MSAQRLRYVLRDFPNAFPRADMMERDQPDLVENVVNLQLTARRFGDKHVRPFAVQWDHNAGEDHKFVAWDAINAGCEYGFFGAMIPTAFGGLGQRGPATAIMMEELCAADAGIANVFGAHGLGIVPLLLSLDMSWFFRHLREVTDEEKKGNPVIFALAHTEPGAGSDVEDAEFGKTAKLCTVARKVPGGYRVSGSKVFISNGSIARYIWLSAVMDKSKMIETNIQFIHPHDAEGFSVARVERKLGQRLCPAAELHYDDVFIPDENVVGDVGGSPRMIDHALSITRGPVGAIATGIARGALERTLDYLEQKRSNGQWLFEEQWVQLALAEMVSRIQAARQLYMDSVISVETLGFLKVMDPKNVKLLDYLPESWLRSERLKRWMANPRTIASMKKREEKLISDADLEHVMGLASMAKFMCSDMAMQVCKQAMEILGEDAIDPSWGVEKCLRDAKLTQIYEGTNQLNRLHVTKGLITRE